jgi:hypothetical protein
MPCRLHLNYVVGKDLHRNLCKRGNVCSFRTFDTRNTHKHHQEHHLATFIKPLKEYRKLIYIFSSTHLGAVITFVYLSF